MKKSYKIRRQKDGTITVRVGRDIEHISGDLSKAETYDRVKYALISKGIFLKPETLIELL